MATHVHGYVVLVNGRGCGQQVMRQLLLRNIGKGCVSGAVSVAGIVLEQAEDVLSVDVAGGVG